VVLHAIGAARERDGFRIVHFTIQRNHLTRLWRRAMRWRSHAGYKRYRFALRAR
jgi:hypothetical protein